MSTILKHKDIDQMTADNITQDLVDYYYRLSEGRKLEFAKNRPNLVESINAWTGKSTGEQPVEGFDLPNSYEGMKISDIVKDDFRPVEALTIGDNKTTCPAHRTELTKFNVSFHKPNGQSLGRDFYYCDKCHRLFIKKSAYQATIDRLKEWNIPCNIYDYDISRKYLLSQSEPYQLSIDEKIYVPKNWVEENPKCPIHNCELEEVQCCIKYKERAVTFDAYYCEDCDKVIMRRTSMQNLEDEFARSGIPEVSIEILESKEPPKKKIYKPIKKPDYYINNGKRLNYDGEDAFYELDEHDIIVVSDSIYCTIDGHDSNETVGKVEVIEREGNKKYYLVLLGYCAECQKYYMDVVDYRTIYKHGRPKVSISIDLDDDEYMTTSGQEFDLESRHLSETEDVIDSCIKDIKSQPDYVSQYATSSYYDEGLAADKRRSKEKYGEILENLNSYINKPYKYRVNVTVDGKTKTYYIGAKDIDLNSQYRVISASSRLGRDLVSSRNTKVNIGGEECPIILSREFDINNATLYGYRNIRTNEDVIFRAGITDPFLMKALKVRKRKNDLTDIFVTIQENQNAIVDTPFKKNIIVQGCAGSGKTMVMLHRLSSLKYEWPDFDFTHEALILTPNENFNLHIRGLAEELQVGAIPRISIEEYYKKLLDDYGREIKYEGDVLSEFNINQDFVNYIYSDGFRTDFTEWYRLVIDERNKLVTKLNELQMSMLEESTYIDVTDDSTVNEQLGKVIYPLNKAIEEREKAIETSKAELENLEAKGNELISAIPRYKELLAEEIDSSKIRANSMALESIISKGNRIVEASKQAEKIEKELVLLQRNLDSAKCIKDIASLNDYLSIDDSYATDEIHKLKTELEKNEKQLQKYNSWRERVNKILLMSDEEIVLDISIGDKTIIALQEEIKTTQANVDATKKELQVVENGINPFGKQRRISAVQAEIDKASASISDNKSKIIDRYKDITAILTNECNKLENTIREDYEAICTHIENKSRIKIRTLKGQLTKAKNSIESGERYVEAAEKLLMQLQENSEEFDYFRWIKSALDIGVPLNDESRKCNLIKIRIDNNEEQLSSLEIDIGNARLNYETALANRYSENIRNNAESITKSIKLSSANDLFKKIFKLSIEQYPKHEEFPKETNKCYRYELYARLMFAKLYYGKKSSKISFICIDEGQDLSVNEYRLIRDINDPKTVFNIFGDINQSITKARSISDWNNLRRLISVELFTLNQNYRNTNQITRFCNESFNMNVLQTGVDGALVREVTRDEFDNELADIVVEDLKIAILIPRGVSKKKFIKKDILSDNVKSILGNEIDNGRIALMYVDEVKGIEFDKVYVLSAGMGRNEKYIAYTRALSELIIIVDPSATSTELEEDYNEETPYISNTDDTEEASGEDNNHDCKSNREEW